MKRYLLYVSVLSLIQAPCQTQFKDANVSPPDIHSSKSQITCSNITGGQKIVTIPIQNKSGCRASCETGSVSASNDWKCGGGINSFTYLDPGESGSVTLTCDYSGKKELGCSVPMEYNAEIICECDDESVANAMESSKNYQINQALEYTRQAQRQSAQYNRSRQSSSGNTRSNQSSGPSECENARSTLTFCQETWGNCEAQQNWVNIACGSSGSTSEGNSRPSKTCHCKKSIGGGDSRQIIDLGIREESECNREYPDENATYWCN